MNLIDVPLYVENYLFMSQCPHAVNCRQKKYARVTIIYYIHIQIMYKIISLRCVYARSAERSLL